MKLLDPETLARGTDRQKAAYHALKDLHLFETLREFSPVVAGTIPLDVDTPESDLDIICSAENIEAFADYAREKFGTLEGFRSIRKVMLGRPTFIARFRSGGFQIELFTQSQSVFTSPAVLHMLVEARLLAFATGDARGRIRALKMAGVKTEPAFAEVFAIEGDPYEELLKLARLPDNELLHVAHRFLFNPQ